MFVEDRYLTVNTLWESVNIDVDIQLNKLQFRPMTGTEIKVGKQVLLPATGYFRIQVGTGSNTSMM